MKRSKTSSSPRMCTQQLECLLNPLRRRTRVTRIWLAPPAFPGTNCNLTSSRKSNMIRKRASKTRKKTMISILEGPKWTSSKREPEISS